MDKQVVRFARIKGRQKAYIDFFNALIAELNEQPGFHGVLAAPTGVNWHHVKHSIAQGRRQASFVYSFGRGGIFRVELYIDIGDKALNKSLYDGLASQRPDIEKHIGHQLTWQRMDDRRASRIAWVFKARITDDEEALGKLRQSAVPAMVRFHRVLGPRIEAVAEDLI
jgi:hypothetical protein